MPENNVSKNKKTSHKQESTPRRLIIAAIELFGEMGYERVTTRMLANKAQANQAAIPYHFGGKEGLYLRTAEYVAESIFQRTVPVYGAIHQRVESEMSQEDCALWIATLLNSMIDGIIGLNGDQSVVRFVFREYMEPGQAFHIIYDNVIVRNHKALSSLVGRMLGLDLQCDEAVIRGHAIAGQVIGMVAARTVLLKRLGRKQYTAEDIETMRAVILENTLRGLGVSEEVMISSIQAAKVNDLSEIDSNHLERSKE